MARPRFLAFGTCKECGDAWAVPAGGRVRAAHEAGFCGSECLGRRVGRLLVSDPRELAWVEERTRELLG